MVGTSLLAATWHPHVAIITMHRGLCTDHEASLFSASLTFASLLLLLSCLIHQVATLNPYHPPPHISRLPEDINTIQHWFPISLFTFCAGSIV